VRIDVLFFAQARDCVGASSAGLELPEASRVADALEALQRTHPKLAALRPHLAVAVNGELAREGDTLVDGAEVALLPPVSGG